MPITLLGADDMTSAVACLCALSLIVATASGQAKPACWVDPARELVVTNLAVVNNPLRTTWATDPSVDPRAAAWTFGGLMQKVVGRQNGQVMVRPVAASCDSAAAAERRVSEPNRVNCMVA